jgi:hypothetical protein
MEPRATPEPALTSHACHVVSCQARFPYWSDLGDQGWPACVYVATEVLEPGLLQPGSCTSCMSAMHFELYRSLG